MKKHLTFSLITFFGFLSLIHAQSTLKFYNIKIKSEQITGLKSFMNTDDNAIYAEILESNDKWIIRDTLDYTDVIGAYTDDDQSYIPRPLFNISTFNKQFPFLDIIDMEYYETVGFDILKKRSPKIYSTQLFKEFRKEFTEAKTSSDKKKVLLNPSYEDFKQDVVSTRLKFTPSAPFELTKEQQSRYTLKLKAELKSEINKIDVNIGAKLDTYIDRLVDNSTQIKGEFVRVGFNPDYSEYLNTYITSADSKKLKRDFFVTQLEKYINSNYARLITQIGVLFFEASYDKTVISSSKIATDLKTEYKLAPATANKISAEVIATFERKEEINLNADFTGAFIIAFITDKKLDKLDFRASVETKSILKDIK